MKPDNLRREARVDARIQVYVVRGRQSVPLETSDVSFKGLFVRTSEPPAVRSLVRLRVRLPLREIHAHAMAVHIAGDVNGRSPGVGLQFWGLAGPDRVAWDDFIRELLQMKRVSARPPPPPALTDSESMLATDNPTPSGIRIANIVDLDESSIERASSHDVG
jgi:hypothetical protein